MKSIKKMAAIMILAAVATLSTPQAYAGIMIDDVRATNAERDSGGIGILDIAGQVYSIVGIMIGDLASIMIGD